MAGHQRSSPKAVLALNTYIKLRRASESVVARLCRGGTLGNLTFSQFAVLEALYHLGPLHQNQIGAKTLRSPGNLTLVIDNLEKHDLVTRTPDPADRRATQVALTPRGQALIERILPDHVTAITDELGVLTAAEQRQLGELCKKLGLGSR